ncbi:hemerythrin domain-containing protein [Demequina iriomotensis]|uniref:hemerythrin domain-containing protein n=1 Tax=Demequina iriomotensis TaxID=1536641 RepID=UPI0007839203|nr:hemerythrin domain-containing protein [Demequina iriomotensis]
MTAIVPPDQRPDIQEMVVIHRAFRREFTAVPAYIRATPRGDLARSAVVAQHLRLCMAGLEMHHTGEDIVLWPLLLERAAPSTGLVETMQEQHHGVDAHIAAVEPALVAWEGRAQVEDGERLAALVEAFSAALFEHLDLEEREILPLAYRHVTDAEWRQMGQHGTETMKTRELPIMFGLVLEDADAEERTRMLATLPVPVRVVLRTVGAWQFRRYVRRLRGR